MVTITNLEAIQAKAALEGLAQIIYPGGTALRIKRMYREIAAIVADVEALRVEALQRLGKHGDDGQLVTDDKGNVAFPTVEAAREFAAYVRSIHEATVEVRYMLTEAEATSRDVAPGLLIGLGGLLVEDTEKGE